MIIDWSGLFANAHVLSGGLLPSESGVTTAFVPASTFGSIEQGTGPALAGVATGSAIAGATLGVRIAGEDVGPNIGGDTVGPEV